MYTRYLFAENYRTHGHTRNACVKTIRANPSKVRNAKSLFEQGETCITYHTPSHPHLHICSHCTLHTCTCTPAHTTHLHLHTCTHYTLHTTHLHLHTCTPAHTTHCTLHTAHLHLHHTRLLLHLHRRYALHHTSATDAPAGSTCAMGTCVLCCRTPPPKSLRYTLLIRRVGLTHICTVYAR